ncbi:MAG: hypothetical protein C0506_12830 [Anaerolinea sp.]|nr:hypothetical protein [Anaerolinea sp.]
MSTEEWIIVAVRVAGSLPVLRWPFAGGCIAVATDLSDLFLRSYLQLGGVSNYQSFDKWLDQIYLGLFLVVALRWRGPARAVAIGLFAFRLAGFAVFEASGERWTLLLFPNVFEFWFLFVAGAQRWWPEFRYRAGPIAAVLGPLAVLKLFQEYALHVGRWLDDFTAREAVEAVTSFFT